MKNLFYAVSVLALLSIPQSIWGQKSVLVKTNLEGEVVKGSIEDLIEAIQEGASIRVGWQLDLNEDGKPDLEHWVDAEFISILGGHVFTQIPPIFRQVPDWEGPQIKIIQSEMQWTALIGTNGKLLSRFIIPNIDQFPSMDVREQLAAQTEINERMVWTTWTRVD